MHAEKMRRSRNAVAKRLHCGFAASVRHAFASRLRSGFAASARHAFASRMRPVASRLQPIKDISIMKSLRDCVAASPHLFGMHSLRDCVAASPRRLGMHSLRDCDQSLRDCNLLRIYQSCRRFASVRHAFASQLRSVASRLQPTKDISIVFEMAEKNSNISIAFIRKRITPKAPGSVLITFFFLKFVY